LSGNGGPSLAAGEVAQKAIKEIATVPLRLMFYSILGAVGLVLSGCVRNVVALAL